MRGLLTASCLVAALACHALGMHAGGLAFIVAGMGCELAFWWRVLSPAGARRAATPPPSLRH